MPRAGAAFRLSGIVLASRNRDPILIETLATAIATARTRRVAYSRALVMLVGSLACVPAAQLAGPSLPGFLAAFGAAEFLVHAITAFLLYGLFYLHARPALALLAAGYVFSGLIVVPYVLFVPGIYPRLLEVPGHSQVSFWIWIVWHTGAPLYVLGYTLLGRPRPSSPLGEPGLHRWCLWSLGATLAAVAFATLAVLLAADGLPRLIDGNQYDEFRLAPGGVAIIVLNLAALLALAGATRLRTALDLWLAVAVFAGLLDVLLSNLSGARFSVGWYAARVNSLLSGAIVLIAFLHEIQRHYRELARRAATAPDPERPS